MTGAGRPAQRRPAAAVLLAVLFSLLTGLLTPAPALAAPALAAPALAAPALAAPSPASATTGRTPARTVSPPPVRLALTAVSAAAITPGSSYTVRGTITNTGPAPIVDVTVGLRLDWRRLDRAGLQAWADRPPTAPTATRWDGASTQLPTPLTPGETATFVIVARADALNLPRGADGFGPRGLAVEARGDTGTGAQQLDVLRTSVVWAPSPPTAGAALSVLVPVTASARAASSDAGIPNQTVVQEWEAQGRLSRVLAAADDPALSWLIDPALITAASAASSDSRISPSPSNPPASGSPASGDQGSRTPISGAAAPTGPPGPVGTPDSRLATTPATDPTSPGSPGDAPDARTAATAAGWLNALVDGSRSREVYPLPWADPDLVALARSDAWTTLSAARADASATSRTAFGRELPQPLAWPAAGQLDRRTLGFLGGSATGPIVVSDAVLGPTPTGAMWPAHVGLPVSSETGRGGPMPDGAGASAAGSTSALVADRVLSRAVAQMAGAQSVVATQRVLAELAVAAIVPAGAVAVQPSPATPPGQPVTALAAIPRSWNPQPRAMREALALLRSAPWVRVQPLRATLAAPAAPGPRQLAAYPSTARRAEVPVPHVRAVSGSFDRLMAFAPALTQPQLVVPAARRSALSLVSTGWRSPQLSSAQREDALAQARRPLLDQVDALYGGIEVLTSNATNLLARSGRLPVTVLSRLPQPVTVSVGLRPLSGRLVVDVPPQTVTVGAAPNATTAARATVLTPVKAVANGDVSIEVTLAATGANAPLVTSASPVLVRIRRDWEDRGLIAAVVVLVALLVAGLIRGVRRGRRRLPPESSPDPDDIGLVARPDPQPTSEPVGARAPGAGVGPGAAMGQDSGALPGGPPAPDGRLLPDPTGPPTAAIPVKRALAAAGPDRDDDSLARSSALMAAGTLVSRVLGMVRVVVLSAAIGSAVSSDAFNVANTLPNSLFILIGGGVLNAVLVPQIVRAAQRSDGGKDYTDRLLTLAIVVLGGATVVLTAAAALLVRLYSNNWDGPTIDLATTFALWCLPQIFFYGLYTLYGQVLNARGSFGPYMWAPVVNNVVAIAGMLAFIAVAGAGTRPSSEFSALDITVLAGTATLGVVAQALVLVPVLRRHGYRWRPRFGWRGVGLRTAGTVAGWTFAGVAVAQAAFVVTSRIATAAGAATADPATNRNVGRTIYDYAYLLFMLPHSLIAVSIVTAVFTRMSAAAAQARLGDVREDLSVSLRTIAVATVLATAAFAVLGTDLARGMFLGTDRATTDQYGLVAAAMMLGLVPFSAQYLFQRVCYAFEDARTPFLIGALVTGLWTAGNVVVWFALPAEHVIVGIALALSLANIAGCAAFLPHLRRRLGDLDGRRVAGTHARLAVAATVAAGVAWLVKAGVLAVLGDGQVATYAVLALAGGALLATYALGLRMLRVTELDDLVRPVLRRFRPADPLQ